MFGYVFAYSQKSNTEPQGGLNLPVPPSGNPNTPSIEQQEALRDYAIITVNEIEENTSFISKLNSVDSALILPQGISKKIGGIRYTIAIDSMKFKPDGAYLSAYAAVKFPGASGSNNNRTIAFGAKNIKFNPEGVLGGEQTKLYLLSDHTITINQDVKLVLKGSEPANWVSWNCGGFEKIHLKGRFIFNSSKFTPAPGLTTDPNVTATFETECASLQDFIVSVSITPFNISGLNNVSFQVNNATVDFSETANLPGMTFPIGYNNPNLFEPSSSNENSNQSQGNYLPQLWTGFYLQSLTVYLPPELNKNNTRTSITASNLLIDQMGFTGRVTANNVFNTSEGSMSGWGFSLDQIGLDFVCNNLVSGNLAGKVGIPIDEVKSLNYAAVVSKSPNSSNLNYLFTISPTDNIKLTAFGANININNNSSINVALLNNKFKPTAILNGNIEFEIPKFNSNNGQLIFQNLTIVTEAPYITNGLFGLGLSNGATLKCKNFSLSLNHLLIGVNQGKPRLLAGVGIAFSEADSWNIGINTQIVVQGKIEPTSNPMFAGFGRLALESCNVDGVQLNFSAGPVSLEGGILFNDNHPVYGDGFFGNIKVNIDQILEMPSIAVGFGKKPNYKYFFVNAIVPGPIPIPSTPVIITSIVGGITYHVKPNKLTDNEYMAMANTYAANPSMNSPMNFVPTETVGLGLKVGVNTLIGSNITAGAALTILFNTGGGINTVNLKGNVQAMAGGVPITGNMDLNYDFPTKTFDGLFGISATYYGLINGSGLLKIHSNPSNWHICFGRPSQPFTANMFFLANVNGYFMTGTQLENVSFGNVPSGNRQPAQLSNGSAMCMGAWVSANLGNNAFGWDFFTVTPTFNFQMGVDGMLKNYGPNATCTNDGQPFGINGKYLQANAYLNLSGGINITGHFKFPSNCPTSYGTHAICGPGHCCCATVEVPCIVNSGFNFNILNAPNITANLTVKLPKPLYFAGNLNAGYSYFGGRLNGNVAFNYKYGTNCNTPY